MIGVFDSGSGGLTVLRAFERALPHQSFLYLGDHGNAPYGNRSPSAIYDLTLRSLELLFDRGCSLVVMACNTAAATGLRQLQQTWLPFVHPTRRVIGVIVPVVEEITGVPWIGDGVTESACCPELVAVLATQHTVQTHAYVTEIQKRAPGVRVEQQGCPDLVSLIEEKAPDSVLRTVVRNYVGALLDTCHDIPDVCILGCTHYPLIEHIFADELPKGIRLLSQADVSANSLAHYLVRHPEYRSSGPTRREFFTTGNASHVSSLASRFYGRPVLFEPIKLREPSWAGRPPNTTASGSITPSSTIAGPMT